MAGVGLPMVRITYVRDVQVPVTDTPWSWRCPRKGSQIAAEKCRQMQQRDGCTCQHADKVPSEDEMKQARSMQKPHKMDRKDQRVPLKVCAAAKGKFFDKIECPLNISASAIRTKRIVCEYRIRAGKGNGIRAGTGTLSICTWRQKKQPEKGAASVPKRKETLIKDTSMPRPSAVSSKKLDGGPKSKGRKQRVG